MASSQLKSEGAAGEAGGAVFPFAWRSPAISGSETVITNLRPELPISPSDQFLNEQPPDLLHRLFPTGTDTDDASGICLGHFTIQRRIGIGGMGSVYLATDERLRRNVALKVLSPALTSDPAAVLRFQNEARAAARLDHDNIARIFYYGEDCGLHYIAYEYIPGSNLRDVIRSKDRLVPAEAVNYAMQLAAALSHTAAAGVIHRDIKPSNVLITPLGRAKLVDLGLARKESVDSSVDLTVAGTTLGTFDYISPEQAKDPRNVDVRSDIYSLGCTLYHMLTGEPPYPEGTVLQKLLDHQGKDAPDPARKNRRVPPELSLIVRKMMASDPRRRYGTPAKLLSDLLHVARQLGTGAVPIDGQVWLTATQSDRRPWQGNIAWIGTAALLLLLVIAMEKFPRESQQLYSRSKTGASVSPAGGKSLSRPVSSVSDAPSLSQAATSKNPDLDSESPWYSQTTPTTSTAAAAGGRVALDATKSDAATSQNVYEPPPPPFTDISAPDGLDKVLGTSLVKPTMAVTPSPSGNADSTPNLPAPKRSGVNGVATVATPSLPAESTSTADARPAIFIGAKSYSTLEAACLDAKDESLIELRYTGRRGKPEDPFRMSNKDHVRIRGGAGFRPVIEFAPTEPLTDDAQARMITLTGGSLELSGVDLTLTIPERVTPDRWALFKLERPRSLKLNDVTVTIVNPGRQSACVIEQAAAPGQGVGNVGMMKNGEPSEPPEVSIFNGFFRGHCDLISLRDAVPVRFALQNTVAGLQGVLLRANCQTKVSTSESDVVVVDLDRTTCLTAEGLIFTEGIDNLTDHTPPLRVTARDNIFWCAPNHPLVTLIDTSDLMDINRRFTWSGDRNRYDALGIFLQLGGRQGPTSAQYLDFERWRNYWGADEGAASVNAPIAWRIKPGDRAWSSIDLPAIELEPGLSTSGEVSGAALKKAVTSSNDTLELDDF